MTGLRGIKLKNKEIKSFEISHLYTGETSTHSLKPKFVIVLKLFVGVSPFECDASSDIEGKSFSH